MLVQASPQTSPEARQKLRELVLYVSDRLERDPNFGAVKLNKIILKADQLSYVRTGKPITNAPYMKLTNGFVPYHMKQILSEMEREKEIVIRSRKTYQYIQLRVLPLRDANVDLFSAKEIALIDEVISDCFDLNGATMSHQSHGTAWKVAEFNDIVPYSAFLLSDNQIVSEADIRQAHELIAKHGWSVSV